MEEKLSVCCTNANENAKTNENSEQAQQQKTLKSVKASDVKVIKTNITTKRITGAKNTTHNCKDRRKKPTKGKRFNVMQNQRNKQTNKQKTFSANYCT